MLKHLLTNEWVEVNNVSVPVRFKPAEGLCEKPLTEYKYQQALRRSQGLLKKGRAKNA